MLLFRQGFHEEVEGRATVAEASSALEHLAKAVQKLQKQIEHRIVDHALAVVEIASLKIQIEDTRLDLVKSKLDQLTQEERRVQLERLSALDVTLTSLQTHFS